MTDHWLSPITIPRDGTVVLVLTVFGVDASFYAPEKGRARKGWWGTMKQGEMFNDEDVLGWLPCPETDWARIVPLRNARLDALKDCLDT